MSKAKAKKYCTVDHANKQKELARWTPYEFWENQVKRKKPPEPPASGEPEEPGTRVRRC